MLDISKFKMTKTIQPKTTRHNHGGSSFIPPELGKLKDYIEANKDKDMNPGGQQGGQNTNACCAGKAQKSYRVIFEEQTKVQEAEKKTARGILE